MPQHLIVSLDLLIDRINTELRISWRTTTRNSVTFQHRFLCLNNLKEELLWASGVGRKIVVHYTVITVLTRVIVS